MKTEKLKQVLQDEGFKEDAYSFDEKHPNEALCLRQENNQWCVFYAERGLQTGKTLFETEELACEYFLTNMEADPTTRQNWKSGFSMPKQNNTKIV